MPLLPSRQITTTSQLKLKECGLLASTNTTPIIYCVDPLTIRTQWHASRNLSESKECGLLASQVPIPLPSSIWIIDNQDAMAPSKTSNNKTEGDKDSSSNKGPDHQSQSKGDIEGLPMYTFGSKNNEKTLVIKGKEAPPNYLLHPTNHCGKIRFHILEIHLLWLLLLKY